MPRSLAFFLVALALASPAWGQVLTPPYFNLAEGRRITATSTCGLRVAEPELYCKLVGANSDRPINFNVIKGQLCDYCDPNNPHQKHPPEFAIDGSERWWQSPPLSRGMDYNEVNLTIDLGQLFQVAYVVIKMANSPRPGIWVLERSVDNGKTYTPWQYFADNDGDCKLFFGEDALGAIEEDDDVICTTRFSKVVPLEGGEIFVSLLNGRPSAKDFFNSTTLQEFTRATNVRLRLLRTKTLLGHLMSVARQDPTVTRRYFYSIKDISIGGRCVCNGHASVCDIADPDDRYQLQCRCQHNTCGAQCEECCPGFIQKKWRPASYTENFVCEPCNCYGHSNECLYDEEVSQQGLSRDIHGFFEGGGVCQNCHHNTEGINCHKCTPGYYRPADKYLNDTDACQPCDCTNHFYTGNCFEGSGHCECRVEFLPPYCDACNDGYYDYPDCKPCDCHKNGTIGGICQVGGRQCPCKENYVSLNCDQCASGYYKFPECLPCNCHHQGSLDAYCRKTTGDCRCQNNYGGRRCDRCENGYYDFANECLFCNCDSRGTIEDICDKDTGQCLCKEGYSGNRCDSNAPGFWGYPLVQYCGCHEKGSSSTICNPSGKCTCLNGYAGRACDQCSPGFHSFPDCKPCHCDQAGSIGISCDENGRCQCKYNFDGIYCDKCRDKFYNFPLCEECNCDPAGVLETFAGCGNAPVGELCECKERVSGRICHRCNPLFWNLQQNNPYGCEECSCHTPGTVGALATCDMTTGQCQCKPRVAAPRCNECRDETFNLMEDNLFGCSDCKCNIGGSNNNVCNKVTGQCPCRHRIQGQRCDEPMKTHYFPTLYQHKYEIEDGRTPQNTPVKFDYDERVFPGYSWRGYAVYSSLRMETVHEVHINKPSLYRLIFYYMNPSDQIIKGKITITPENPQEEKQEEDIYFQPTSGPQLMTVSTLNGFPLTFVMSPGTWMVSIQNSQTIYLDYMILLPSAYYEATILTEEVTSPSDIRRDDQPSIHFGYPTAQDSTTIYGSAGYIDLNGTRSRSVQLYRDQQVLAELGSPSMAWLGANSERIQFEMRLRKPGKHVILLNYFTPNGGKASSVVVTSYTRDGIQKGRSILYDCTYTWVCKQVVSNLQGEIAVFDFDTINVNIIISIRGESGQDIALQSITVVPLENWHMDLITPHPVCVRLGGECLASPFLYPSDAVKVEAETNFEGKSAESVPWGVNNSTVLVYLNESDPMVDMTGKLRQPGRYVFIVHYFQPDHPEFKMEVLIQNGQFYEALLPLEHCPSVDGCRSVITHLDGYTTVFDILENFVLTLKQSASFNVWLDYILVLPEQTFTPDILKSIPRDQTEEFLQRCGGNHFNMDPHETGFCRDAAFSLTADYNNGALPCHCNSQGSSSFECDVFGGQCPCKANIIGRGCNQCKTGYFGFPNCRPCDCPALCDDRTGECICPPRVVGEQCDTCARYTYGFDPNIGCEECRCNEIGVRNGNLQCDSLTGQCQCKDNIVDRRCERCAAGYWSFPFCQLCNCDLRGTEVDICNQNDAECYCKANTEGPSCDLCVPGTYHLEESNPDGCTKCFCFGKTQFCSSSNLFWTKLPQAQGWRAVQMKFTESSAFPKTQTLPPEEYRDVILMNLTQFYEPKRDGYVYLAAPSGYHGNRLMSYGGSISFKLLVISDEQGDDLSNDADLVLQGGNLTALYFHPTPIRSGFVNKIEIELIERKFRTMEGVPMKREQFMIILHKLDGLFFRIQYGSYSTQARLNMLQITTATGDYHSAGVPAFSVETCQCPPNYSGTSCEDCAEGYFRTSTGPYGGFCVPCKCNNHADTCDPVTGKCFNCRDNTVGFHCEKCAPGYFGDVKKGTPYDCLICSCPHPSVTNNFATSCQLAPNNDDIECQCREGYRGSTCGICAPGYYGQPNIIGDYCKLCECNQNIDASSQYGCDNINGLCLSCLNNTYGSQCERCAPGFYGDAIVLKNCQRIYPKHSDSVKCDRKRTETVFSTFYEASTGVSPNSPYSYRGRASRYEDYLPLEQYRAKYGTLIGTHYDKSRSYSGHKSDRQFQKIVIQDGKVIGLSVDGIEKILRNSSGLSVYSTLTNPQEKRKPQIVTPRRSFSSSRTTEAAGEGFGSAYLEWSEHGRGCSCDECGTRECQHYTGVCECHANVIGDRCDRCAPEYWGFASCQGCHRCNCHEASESRQCDEETGQCRCRPGVTGQQCDRCKPGFWRYTEFGCTECSCRAGFSIGVGCDPVTGQCSCLPGVIGDNCEGCPNRWVLVEGAGCQECDDCVEALLDSTDQLKTLISPVILEFESAAQSFFLQQRLQVIKGSIAELRPKVDVLDISDEDLRPIQATLGNLSSEALAVSTKGKLLKERAIGTASEGQAVQDQAREVLDSIFVGTDLIRDVVNEINSLVIGLETGTGAKIEQAIREAERIVLLMKGLDFSPHNDKVRLDFEVADEFLERVRDLSLSGAENQARLDEAASRVRMQEDKLLDISQALESSNKKVNDVDLMNRDSSVYGLPNLQKKHAEIEKLGKETHMQIKEAENFTSLAQMKFENAENIYYEIDSELNILRDANVNLKRSIFNFSEDFNEVKRPANEAIAHSQKLKGMAQELDGMLRVTRQGTGTALMAANAYDNIVSEIDDAYIAALDAKNASDQAVTLSNGVSDDALFSLNASHHKNSLAETKIEQVDDFLFPQLNAAQLEVKSLEAMNEQLYESLTNENRILDNLESDSLELSTEGLQEEALEVDREAQRVDNQVLTQSETLQRSAEVARTLSKNIEDAKRDIKLAMMQVENVRELLPGMQQTTRKLLSQKANIHHHLEDVGDRLERLRRTITKTRDKTNKIKVGIDFEQGAVVELKIPDDLSNTATATELSVFIRTADRSGLPLFLGTPVGGNQHMHRTSTDDFMAIELDEGYARLTIDLGAGPHSIVNSAFIADNKWHKIHVKRIGKVVQLAVHSEDKDRKESVVTAEKVLPGTFSILNLDPKVSKLYAGGIPAGVDVNPTLINTYYNGQMEDLWINKRPLGLWNFVSRGPSDFPLMGSPERLVLKKSDSDSHILRFDGSGYIAMETKGHQTSPNLVVILSFKTFGEDGLIYLVENREQNNEVKEFVSLKISEGKVVYQHRFGNEIAVLRSDGIYNDNQWHTIEATRAGGDAVMKIDNIDFQSSANGNTGADFTRIPNVMYFGGYPGDHAIHSITNEDFRGCISDAKISDINVDFSRSVESIGTVPGCADEPVTLVSFHREAPGYIKLSNPEGSGLQLFFKFRTQSPNGLLFYTETSNRSIYLSLSLAEGALVLRSAPGGEITTGTYTKYNDSDWHIVIATRENNELRLDIDDFEKYTVNLVQASVPFDGPAFFGGFPEYLSFSAAAAATDTNFFGCIGDATLNGRIINFASAAKRDRPGAMLETCSVSKDTTVTTYITDEFGPSYPIDVRPKTSRPFYPYPEAEVTDKAVVDSEISASEDYSTHDPFLTFSEPSFIEQTSPPLESCGLPLEPQRDFEVTESNGLRFGSKRDSRIEYKELPDNIRGDFVFSVEFKTEAQDGIIFYASSLSHRDFVTIYLKEGKVVFSFNPGSQLALMRSTNVYNDNIWHKLIAYRSNDVGRLEVDGFIAATDSSTGDSKHIDHQAPYYFGGLNYDITELASDNTEQTILPFNGCLREFRMNNQVVKGQRKLIAVGQCSYKVEPGAFFGKGELSHAVVRPRFNVGLTFSMDMQIKPRQNSGVLMSVHGRKDFILLQLRDGIVELKVDNGKGIITAQVNMSNPYQICDGEWHTIGVIKNKHVIVVIVDGISSELASGPLGSRSADTNKPLFLGSQPRLSKRRGDAVTEKFIGCMRGLIVNNEKIDLSYILYVGEVNAGVCPLI